MGCAARRGARGARRGALGLAALTVLEASGARGGGAGARLRGVGSVDVAWLAGPGAEAAVTLSVVTWMRAVRTNFTVPEGLPGEDLEWMSHVAPLAFQDQTALMALRSELMRGSCPVGPSGSSCTDSVSFVQAWDEKFHPCTWPGVFCDCLHVYPATDCAEFPEVGLNRVYALDLGATKPSHMILRGALPAALGSFTQLRLLDLQRNAFSGSIPAELGQLPRMERLLLSNNALTGAIPGELGSIPSLRELHLENNLLSGTIPADLCTLLDSQRTPQMPPSFNLFDPSGNAGLCGAVPECLTLAGHLRDRGLVGTRLGSPCQDSQPAALPPEIKKEETTTLLLVIIAATMGVAVAVLYVRHMQSRWRSTRDREQDERLQTIRKTLRGLALPIKGRIGDRRQVAEITEITFVFTDIESSTRMAHLDPAAYQSLQLTHDEIIRDALEETGGYEINTQGDSFELAFGAATQAVRFCLIVQEQLLLFKWPYAVRKLPGCEAVWGREAEGLLYNGPRVRMGIHHAAAGTFDVKQHDFTKTIRFSGKAFETARKVGDIAYGGQILMTEDVHNQIKGNFRHATFPSLTHLGVFSSRNLGSATQHLSLYQVDAGITSRRPVRSFPAEFSGLVLLEEARGMRTEIFPTPCPGNMGIVLTRATNAVGPVGGVAGGSGDLFPAVADEIEKVLSSVAQIFGGILVLQNSNKGEYGYMFEDVLCGMNFCLVSQMALTYRQWELIQEVDSIVQEGQKWGLLDQLLDLLSAGSARQAQYERREVSRGGRLIFNGPRLSMAVHHGNKFSIQGMKERSVALMRSPTFLKKGFSTSMVGSERVIERSSVSGELVDHATEILDISHGGQTVLSEEAWQQVQFRLPDRVQVLSLGLHFLDLDMGRCKGFMEVSTSALSERDFPPLLSCSMASPGYREAPNLAAPMAIVFCQAVVPEGPTTEALRRGITLWSRLCHTLSDHFHGYVCKEPDPGKFTLAFSVLENAILFSVKAQEALLMLDWDEKLLEDSHFEEVKSEEGHIIWRGLRVRIGLAYGMASFKKPLMTGAADYFGSLPNLAARVMSKASGGQVLMEPAEHEGIDFKKIAGMGKSCLLNVSNSEVAFEPVGMYKMKGIGSTVALLSVSLPNLSARTFEKTKGYVGPVKNVNAYLQLKSERLRQESRQSAIGAMTKAMTGARESWTGVLQGQDTTGIGRGPRATSSKRYGSVSEHLPRFILKVAGARDNATQRSSITSQGSLGSFSAYSGNSVTEIQMRRMSGLIPAFLSPGQDDHDPEDENSPRVFSISPSTGSFTLEKPSPRIRKPSMLGLMASVETPFEGGDIETPSPPSKEAERERDGVLHQTPPS